MSLTQAERHFVDTVETKREVQSQREFQNYTIPLPWKRLSNLTRMLRPGKVFMLAGPSKVGKSLIMGNLAIYLQREGWPWKCLPLEDTRSDWKWRALAILENEYELTDDNPETANYRLAIFEKYKEELLQIMENVTENPRVGKKDENGKAVVYPLPWQRVYKWMEKAAESNRVIWVDPLSQIEFCGRNRIKDEEDFVRAILALAAESNRSIGILGHTVKRGGDAANIPPTVEDIQGSALWGRLLQTVVLVHGHEEKKSDLVKTGGIIEEGFSHNRTIIIGAARNGPGSWLKLAFQQGTQGPTFEEIGLIATKKKKESKK